MTDEKITLEWGHNAGLPRGVTSAWGARLLYPDDVLPDRVDYFGPREAELREYLRSHVGDEPWVMARKLSSSGAMKQTSDMDFVLYEDAKVRIVGNPRRSYGYLYVCAYFRDEDL
jgi:hypothetical protein